MKEIIHKQKGLAIHKCLLDRHQLKQSPFVVKIIQKLKDRESKNYKDKNSSIKDN